MQSLLNGHYYEINYTIPFEADFQGDPLKLYYQLRKTCPAPQAGFWQTPEMTVLSASPECFFRYDNLQNKISMYPIKGTCGIQVDKMADQEAKNKLVTSQKCAAELLMITDLLRNDLGRFCKNVTVDKLKHLETFSHYHHLISEISATPLCTTFLDYFDAIFPGGSITGAPKIKVMEHIVQLENRPRGIYTGSLGVIGLQGMTEFNIAIRTMTIQNNKLAFATGSGIVADSTCDDEYQECLLKAKGLLESINTTH